MKYDNRKLEIEKNLKYIMMFMTQSHDTQNVKELRLAVEII